jgi:hypothetical protein
VKFLRDLAQAGGRLASDGADTSTSHGLEEVAVILAGKAADLERDTHDQCQLM